MSVLTNKTNKRMKPFNLQAALSGAPICTRDGKNARIVCTNANIKDFPLVVLVETDEWLNSEMKEETIICMTKKGTRYHGGAKNENDLFMKPVEKTLYINVYKTPEGKYYAGGIYTSKEEAKEKLEPNNRIGTTTITIIE